MRKIITTMAFVGLVLGGGAGVALAGHQDTNGPGPNGHNNHGLCTAYFNGSENGRSHKHQAGPFVALEGAANARDGEDNDDDGQTDEADEVARAVWSWCSSADNNPKGIGGNPDDPNIEGNEGNGKNGKGKG